jgi:hypothetical protein
MRETRAEVQLHAVPPVAVSLEPEIKTHHLADAIYTDKK